MSDTNKLKCSVEWCDAEGKFRFCGIWVCTKHGMEIDIRGVHPEVTSDSTPAPANPLPLQPSPR